MDPARPRPRRLPCTSSPGPSGMPALQCRGTQASGHRAGPPLHPTEGAFSSRAVGSATPPGQGCQPGAPPPLGHWQPTEPQPDRRDLAPCKTDDINLRQQPWRKKWLGFSTQWVIKISSSSRKISIATEHYVISWKKQARGGKQGIAGLF